MTKYSYLFWSTLIGLGIVAGLIYAAALGNVVALVTLVVLATALLIGLGVMLTLLANAAAARREQAAFTANARENLAIMQQMQSLQNAQNSQLLKQVQTQAKLPEPESTESLVIDEALFEEL